MHPLIRLAASCLIVAALPFFGCAKEAPWQVRVTEESDWLLTVAALDDTVLTAGGKPGASPSQPGSGLLVAVPDDVSAAPVRLGSPQPGMLWWVHTLPNSRVAWLCGENGSVLRYAENGGAPELVAVPSGTTATLYGIWANSDDDVWAVGGTEGGPGVVLHGGRSGLSVDSTVPAVPILFKVYAAAPDHLFAVGHAGTLLQRVGGAWRLDTSPTSDRLLTVFGAGAKQVYAVGGLGSGRLVAFDGQRWAVDEAVADFDALAGLFVSPSGDDVLLTGQRGLIARRGGASGAFEVAPPVTTLDLHAALIRGGVRYAAGGNLSQFGLQAPRGVLLKQGELP